jgi:hypothetical protein
MTSLFHIVAPMKAWDGLPCSRIRPGHRCRISDGWWAKLQSLPFPHLATGERLCRCRPGLCPIHPNSFLIFIILIHSLSGKWYPISLVLNFLEAPLHDSQRSCNRASLPEAKNLHICVFWSCWACLSLCERSSSGSKACSTACIPKLFYFIQSCSVECPTNNSCTSTRQRTMVKSGSGSRMGTDPQAWPVLVRNHPLFWD